MTDSTRERRLPIGLSLLGFAAALVLLSLLGPLAVGTDAIFWRLWPLLLIAFGLDLMLGRQQRRLRAGSVALLGLVLVGGVLAEGQGSGAAKAGPAQAEAIKVVAGAARTADLRFDIEAGELRLRAADRRSDETLIEGQLRGAQAPPDVEYTVEDGVGRLSLEAGASQAAFFGAAPLRWDLQLSRELPLRLTINAKAGDLDLDLRRVRLQALELETGASAVRLQLPEGGNPEIKIDAGASSLVLMLPSRVEARVEISAGASSVKVAPRFVAQGENMYVTPGWEQASERIEIEIDAGAASIEIR